MGGALLACGGQTDRAARAQATARAQALDAAERLVSRDPARAATLFGDIAESEDYPEEDRLLARYRQGELCQAVGDLDGAAGHFTAVAVSTHVERAGLAAFRGARLQFVDRGDYTGGRTALLAVARTRPETLGAVQAIETLARARPGDRDHGAWVTAALAVLAEKNTQLAPAAAWWKAHLEVNSLGELAAARASLRGLIARHPGHPRVGSALWLLGDLLRRQGAWRRASGVYDTLSRLEPERGWFIGSNRERRVDDAILTSGRLRLHRMDDPVGAMDRFERLLAAFPESVLADDAAYGLARAMAAAGRAEDARRALTDFIQRYPESRFTRRAKAVLGGAPWPTDVPDGVESALVWRASERP